VNLAIVHGHLSSPPRTTDLPSGDVLTALEVTVPATDELPASSVPVVWFGAPAAAGGWTAGHEVVVVGRVRRRWYRAGPTSQSRTEVLADVVLPASRRAAVGKALAAVHATIGARL
jgi:hypothetical protein